MDLQSTLFMEVREFVKRNFLLVISAILAIISLFFVPFDTVLSYEYQRILKTICILLFFLLIVAGLKECKALDKLATITLGNLKTTTSLCLVLILLPFFSAMLFSNDVSLLTFIPISIATLGMAKRKELVAVVIVLQTVAANIGSSLTPFGNPHNLYIFNFNDKYGFTLMDYEMALIPIVVVGTLAILIMTLMIPKHEMEVKMRDDIKIEHKPKFLVIMAMFILAILTVMNIVPFYITAVIMIAVFLVIMPKVFLTIDYSILCIFFFLFIFANNVTSIDAIRSVLTDLMVWDPMLTTVLVSQFTSNVPSTILLEQFTDNWAAVVVGADIGGFGTPIASMASVITLRLYLLNKEHDVGHYFKVFFLIELVMLAVLIPTYYLVHL